MENREPKFDAITGEPIEGLPERGPPTEPVPNSRIFRDAEGEPIHIIFDENHWCDQQAELTRKVEKLEGSRAVWIVGLLLVIGAMGWIMWEQKNENASLHQEIWNLHVEICSKPDHDPTDCPEPESPL
jgi:hypothetical protein